MVEVKLGVSLLARLPNEAVETDSKRVPRCPKPNWCSLAEKTFLANAENSYCGVFGALLVCSGTDLAAGFGVWLAGF